MWTNAVLFISGQSPASLFPVFGEQSQVIVLFQVSTMIPGISAGIGRILCLVSMSGTMGKSCEIKPPLSRWHVAPFFYALSENYGSPEDDYLTIYEQGRMTQEAKAVYEALLDNSPLDTITLRKTAHLTSHESESRFNRALSDLQADFKIMPVGVVDAGSWHYSFAYDIVARHEPSLAGKCTLSGRVGCSSENSRVVLPFCWCRSIS